MGGEEVGGEEVGGEDRGGVKVCNDYVIIGIEFKYAHCVQTEHTWHISNTLIHS